MSSFCVSLLKAVLLLSSSSLMLWQLCVWIWQHLDIFCLCLHYVGLLVVIISCYISAHNHFIRFVRRFYWNLRWHKPAKDRRFFYFQLYQTAQHVQVVLWCWLFPLVDMDKGSGCVLVDLLFASCCVLGAVSILVTLLAVVFRVALEIHYPPLYRGSVSEEELRTMAEIYNFFVYTVGQLP